LRYEPLTRLISATFARDPRNAQYDLQAFAVMRRVLAADSNCIDVGAHRGSFLKQIVHLAPTGQHLAVEPIPRLFMRLCEAFDEPNVKILPYALSDRSGRTSFQHVTSNPAYSGLLRRRYDRADETIEEIEVEARCLDDLLPREHPVRFIKIDVEGGELLVLLGAAQTLTRHRPFVVFEHGLGGLDTYRARPEQIHALLTQRCGLRVSTLKGWLAGLAPLEGPEFTRRVLDDVDYCFLAHPG